MDLRRKVALAGIMLGVSLGLASDDRAGMNSNLGVLGSSDQPPDVRRPSVGYHSPRIRRTRNKDLDGLARLRSFVLRAERVIAGSQKHLAPREASRSGLRRPMTAWELDKFTQRRRGPNHTAMLAWYAGGPEPSGAAEAQRVPPHCVRASNSRILPLAHGPPLVDAAHRSSMCIVRACVDLCNSPASVVARSREPTEPAGHSASTTASGATGVGCLGDRRESRLG